MTAQNSNFSNSLSKTNPPKVKRRPNFESWQKEHLLNWLNYGSVIDMEDK